MAASAKRDHRAPCEPECVSGHVLDYYVVARYAIRPVVDDYDCLILITHRSPPEEFQNKIEFVILAHERLSRKRRRDRAPFGWALNKTVTSISMLAL
jgi:hypothetical protein